MAKTILVIEDEAPLRKALEQSFRNAGFDVITAPEGQTGLEMAQKNRPDLIVLDVIMPRLDGISVLRKLRDDKEWGATVPIIMLTNFTSAPHIESSLEKKVQAYMVKADSKVSDVIHKAQTLLA